MEITTFHFKPIRLYFIVFKHTIDFSTGYKKQVNGQGLSFRANAITYEIDHLAVYPKTVFDLVVNHVMPSLIKFAC